MHGNDNDDFAVYCKDTQMTQVIQQQVTVSTQTSSWFMSEQELVGLGLELGIKIIDWAFHD